MVSYWGGKGERMGVKSTRLMPLLMQAKEEAVD